MKRELLISVAAPRDRTQLGILRMEAVGEQNGQIIAGPFSAYLKADNQQAKQRGNPSRDPLQAFGDTPLGEYDGYLRATPVTPTVAKKFGPHPVIVLDPVSGPALQAKLNGRSGLLIHGGAPSATGGLRPTFGCVRLSDEHQGKLVAAIRSVSDPWIKVRIAEMETLPS